MSRETSNPRPRRRTAWITLLALGLVVSGRLGCKRSEGKTYPLRGVVQEVQADGALVVAHEDIPGLMPAMVMPFHARPSRGDVLAGDRIEATLVMNDKESWIEDVRVTARGLPTSKPAPQVVSFASPGDAVPDFALVNQDAQPIHLAQYAGRVLVLTFVYTRCPVPEFCPLTLKHFRELDEALARDPALALRAHLLTISFDTAYDTPAVLRSFGRSFTVDHGEGRFARWQFATGSEEQIKAIAGFFGLVYWNEQGQITHSLRTAIIGPDGRVVQVYGDNLWTADEAIGEIRRAAATVGASETRRQERR